MPHLTNQQIKNAEQSAALSAHLLDLLKNALAADTVISGDTRTNDGIIGTGVVIAGFNLTRPLDAATRTPASLSR
jgi:hypothetical protein